MTDGAEWLPATVDGRFGLASLLLEQATIDEEGALSLSAISHAAVREALISLDGVPLGAAFCQTLPGGGTRLGLHRRVPEGACPAGTASLTILLDGRDIAVPLGGRLSAAAPVWFASATWTAGSDPLAALTSGNGSTVVVVSNVLPTGAASRWLPVADFAAAARLAGFRVVLLHHGAASTIAPCIAGLLTSFDVVHHAEQVGVQQVWDPAMPGAWPQPGAALRNVLAGIIAADDPVLMVASSIDIVGSLEKLPVPRRSAVLLGRDAVLAPPMLAAPIARQKAASALRNALASMVAIVPNEGLLHELGRWRGAGAATVLPAGRALAAQQPSPRCSAGLVALGPIASAAAEQVVGRNAIGLPADASLDAIRAALSTARGIVLEPDADDQLAQFARALGRLVIKVLPGENPSPDLIKAALAAEIAANSHTSPAPAGRFDAAGFMAELGLDTQGAKDGSSALVRAVLQARLAGSPAPARTGLLIEPQSGSAEIFAAAFTAVAGPGRVFARSLTGAPAGTLPFHQACTLGMDVMLYDAGDDPDASHVMDERLLTEGLLPMTLEPRALRSDKARLRELRGTAAGATACIGIGRVPTGACLRFALSSELPPGGADVVALVQPGDTARGRLLTLFEATSAAALRRPGAGAVGYDVVPGIAGLDLCAGLTRAHLVEALLAAALLLGCERVLLAPAYAADADLAPALTALAAAGIPAVPAASEPTLRLGVE